MRTLDPQKNLAQRTKILEKSRTLFARQGFAETSMTQIGLACRLTKPALYHYFKSKGDILSGLLEYTWAQTEEQIAKLPKARTLEELLLVTGKAYLDHMEDPRNVELCQISMKECTHNAQVQDQSLSMMKPRMDKKIMDLFGPYFKKGTTRQEIRIFTCQYFGALFYYVFLDKMMGKKLELPAGQEHYLKSLAETFSKSKFGGRNV